MGEHFLVYRAGEHERNLYAHHVGVTVQAGPANRVSAEHVCRGRIEGLHCILPGKLQDVAGATAIDQRADCHGFFRGAGEPQGDHAIGLAAYGDGGPWYIPVKEEYPKGGYEVGAANCSDAVDDILARGIRELMES